MNDFLLHLFTLALFVLPLALAYDFREKSFEAAKALKAIAARSFLVGELLRDTEAVFSPVVPVLLSQNVT